MGESSEGDRRDTGRIHSTPLPPLPQAPADLLEEEYPADLLEEEEEDILPSTSSSEEDILPSTSSSPPPPRCLSPLKGTDSIERMEEKINELEISETEEEMAEMAKLKKAFDRLKSVTNMHTRVMHRVKLLEQPLPEDPQAEEVENPQAEEVEDPQVEVEDPQVEEARFLFAAPGYGPSPIINNLIAKRFAKRDESDKESEPVIGQVLLEKIVDGDLAPCMSGNKKEIYYDDGKDYSLAQGRVRDQMNLSDYLILGDDRKYFKACLNDSNVRFPLDDNKHRDEDVRVCHICDNTRIFLGDWPLHIRSYYHQIKFAIRKKLAGCCFLRNKHIRPHL